jgi:hypothetical protein
LKMATNPTDPPGRGGQGDFDSSNTILIIVEGPGDTTIRPMRPNIPREWPPPRRPWLPPANGNTGAASPPPPENA